MRTRQNYEPKPLFLERMKKLLGNEFSTYMEILNKPLTNSIRCNTLKISSEKLLTRLKSKGWNIIQPFPSNKEIMIVEGKLVDEGYVSDKSENSINDKMNSSIKNSVRVGGWGINGKKLIDLEPGELGRSMEHLLGYYYVQEIASMLPILALKPKPGELVLDIAAAPGSKTTQLAAAMENKGTIIANDVSLKRLKILASNLERCGATNVIITRRDGIALCRRLKEADLKEVDGEQFHETKLHNSQREKLRIKGNLVPYLFDKILVDAPCSGEGTIRSSPITLKMWNPNTIKSLSKLQKALLASALEILKIGGELVYSTCTHAPEENEEVVDFILKNFDNVKIEKISLPIKCRPGLHEWNNKTYNKETEKSCRIYPQDNDTEGFFIVKFRRIK